MKKISFLTSFVFLFLFGCVGNTQQQFNAWKSNFKKNHPGYNFALACPSHDPLGENRKCGYAADKLQSEANEVALGMCSTVNSNCVVVQENDNWVYNSRKNQKTTTVDELDKYIAQCEYIGFKKNTEKMGDCVLKISQTEKQIVNIQSNSSEGDTLANLLILQESLKLLQPPAAPKRNVQCTYNTVGGILGVNCF